MKKSIYITFSLIVLLSISSTTSIATNWANIARLDGLWHFSVGDDYKWSDPAFDVSGWDRLNVPGQWENHYEGYNGFGWYRRSFIINWTPDNTDEIVLFLGRIDDVDEVFVNGIKVGQTGSFFPNYVSAHNVERRYVIPEGILKSGTNVIAVRVYDSGGPGGILGGGKIGFFYNTDNELLSLDMSGMWKFSINRVRGVFDSGFDDSHWGEIRVPGTWESQGYPNHDGLAWYRTRFTLPDELKNETSIYLVLGKIDDYDKVYLNGHLIGRTEYLDDYSRFRSSLAWRLYRVYRIPLSRLEKENVLVVEVRDEMLDGGIYEGPIGLMNRKNANIILERNRPSFWEDPLRAIMRYF